MNVYRYRFTSTCPVNGAAIAYALEIETTETIMVEDLVAECGRFPDAFHEAIAEALYARFGGRQTLKAHHHGVDIRTIRGPAPAMFAERCREIARTLRGHEAHRALDLLTNEVLTVLGYGEGIQIFEAAVATWHRAGDTYPRPGPCPDCESTTTESTS